MEPPIEITGTLIIVTLCQNGVLICADQGGFINDESGAPQLVSRVEKKVFRLAPNIVSTGCGSIKFLDANNNFAEVFNAFEVVGDYFNKRDFENTEVFWKTLEDELKETFNQKLIAGRRIDEWPPEDPEDDKILMTLVFFFINGAGEICLTELPFRYVRQVPLDTSINRDTPWFKGLVYAKGHTALLARLRDGNRSLRDISSVPLVRMFLSERTDPQTIGLQDAFEFSRIVMNASEERLPEPRASSEFKCEILVGSFRFLPLEKPRMKKRRASKQKTRRHK
jgi:hypothetical protein